MSKFELSVLELFGLEGKKTEHRPQAKLLTLPCNTVMPSRNSTRRILSGNLEWVITRTHTHTHTHSQRINRISTFRIHFKQCVDRELGRKRGGGVHGHELFFCAAHST